MSTRPLNVLLKNGVTWQLRSGNIPTWSSVGNSAGVLASPRPDNKNPAARAISKPDLACSAGEHTIKTWLGLSIRRTHNPADMCWLFNKVIISLDIFSKIPASALGSTLALHRVRERRLIRLWDFYHNNFLHHNRLKCVWPGLLDHETTEVRKHCGATYSASLTKFTFHPAQPISSLSASSHSRWLCIDIQNYEVSKVWLQSFALKFGPECAISRYQVGSLSRESVAI